MKEATEIRQRAEDTMNRDDGAVVLSHTWRPLLQRPSDGKEAGADLTDLSGPPHLQLRTCQQSSQEDVKGKKNEISYL